ncbi:MAG: PKD domain-containing protein, partial [Dehalococcoidia bacterium]|nr:PKD domain-containing protein [Dehalococcoidia bacterium]
SWEWTTGETTQSIVVSTSDIYGVTITDENGCQSYCDIEVTVNNGPMADFWSDVQSCSNPLTVQFTDQSIPGDNDIVSWEWDFGDGETSADQSPSHTYDTPGTYTVILTVTDELGCYDDETKEAYITSNEGPTAAFSAIPTSGYAPLDVDFTDNSVPGDHHIKFYDWDFGDGNTSVLQNPSHTYNDVGIYTVTLTVTDEHGCSDNATATVVVNIPPPPTPAGGCPSTRYLTVDWEGNNTTEILYSNDKLAVDLLGPSPDISDSLFLERGTHAPVVHTRTYYLIVVRELEEIPPLPENYEAIVVLNITPTDAEFNKDILLTLGLNQTQLPQNILNLTMAYYDDVNGLWQNMEYEAGGPNGVAELTLSAPINHFSIYGVLAEVSPSPTTPAHFVPSGLTIVPTVEKISAFVTKTGEIVTISANVANDGGEEGTYIVVLKLNGQTVDTKTVTIAAGQSPQVSFTRSGLDYGQYDVDVAGLTRTFTVSRTITWWLIILIIVAIGLIIWGSIWGTRRRRKAQQEA